MLMIITLHLFFRSKALENMNSINLNFIFTWIFEAISYTSVNIFVMITGFLNINLKFSIKRIINMMIITWFYSIIFLITSVVVIPNQINIVNIIESIFPVMSGQYWFVTTYILLYIITPIINYVINSISQRLHKSIIYISIVIFSIIPTIFPFTDVNISLNGGTNLIWFIVLYFIGAYIKKYNINIRKNICALIGIGFIIVIFLSKLFIFIITKILIGKPVGSSIFYHHNSFLVLGSAIFIFLYFIKMKIKDTKYTKMILSISKLSFAVYIIHENIYIRNNMWNIIFLREVFNKWYWPIFSITVVVVIYIICIIIEFIRVKLLNILGVNNKISKIVDGLNFIIKKIY